MASYTGSALTFWPPTTRDRNWNIVDGTAKIASDIISVCLIKKGEDPVHPELGIAVDLFDPLTYFPAAYWQHNMREEIVRWASGTGDQPIIQALSVKIHPNPNANNALGADILFQPKGTPTIHTLAFPFSAYTGAVQQSQIEPFMKSISLDGDKFLGRFR